MNGKLIRHPPTTHALSVAKRKLSDFLQDHRRLAINSGEPVNGEVIIEIFRKEIEEDHTNKPRTTLYKQETLIGLKKSWPGLVSTHIAKTTHRARGLFRDLNNSFPLVTCKEGPCKPERRSWGRRL